MQQLPERILEGVAHPPLLTENIGGRPHRSVQQPHTLARTPSDNLEVLRLKLVGDQYGASAHLREWMREALPTERCWLVLDALD
ncbi:MAG TPA: hypothetical protein VIU62_11100, partial [Chloroflexota bacterium]